MSAEFVPAPPSMPEEGIHAPTEVGVAWQENPASHEQQARVFDTVLSSIQDFAYCFDRQGRFVYANKALLDLWGLKLEEAVGKDFFDLHYPDELAAKLQRQIGEVFETRRPVVDRTPYTSPTGIPGYYEYILTPVIEADGAVSLVAGSTRDISERQNALEALRTSEENFRQLADAMPQIVWGAQPDGALDYYNRRWFDYINVPPDDLERARWDQYVHPDDLQRAGHAWAEALRTGKTYAVEFRVRGADGAYRWFLVRAMPVCNAQNEVTRWFGTCTDIHDQRRLMQERDELLESERAARSEAERAGRMKDEFLATLSHELRTPLNAIFGWTQLLKQSMDDPETLAEGIDVIDRNVRMQTQLIEDLLDMSRIISGKLRLDVQSVEPAACIEAAIETVAPAAAAKTIRIETILDPKAGPISGDPGRIQQVIWNLLSNALKFTPRGGKVQIVLKRINSHVEITVADSGQGIPAAFLPYVFDRFRQADAATTRKFGGLGLGLAIVKQLVEMHGGTIAVASAGVDQGTAFTLSLPLTAVRVAEDDSPQHPAARRIMAGQKLQANLAGVRILIVDDERDSRELLRRVLEEYDATVLSAASAPVALALVQAHHPDLVVTDIGMADVDGYEFLRRIRMLPAAEGGTTPAIALTAFARSEDKTRALLAGFLAHIAKPVEPLELVATIASVAGRIDSGGGTRA